VEFVNWMGQEGLPFSLVFTKADKLSRHALASTIESWKKKLGDRWEEFPPMFATSATDRRGKDELLTYIGQLLPSGV
jgi:GTP-binding protein